jgi:protein-tyrosine phosphatase
LRGKIKAESVLNRTEKNSNFEFLIRKTMIRIFWIDKYDGPARLGIMARPRGGEWLEEEIISMKKQNVGVLVSLLESEEVYELGLEGEEKACLNNGLGYISFPIKDRDIPKDENKLESFIGLLMQKLNDGISVVIHCRMGIGRSSIIAACILLKKGLKAKEIFTEIRKSRGMKVPDTDTQIAWVEHRERK